MIAYVMILGNRFFVIWGISIELGFHMPQFTFLPASSGNIVVRYPGARLFFYFVEQYQLCFSSSKCKKFLSQFKTQIYRRCVLVGSTGNCKGSVPLYFFQLVRFQRCTVIKGCTYIFKYWSYECSVNVQFGVWCNTQ